MLMMKMYEALYNLIAASCNLITKQLQVKLSLSSKCLNSDSEY